MDKRIKGNKELMSVPVIEAWPKWKMIGEVMIIISLLMLTLPFSWAGVYSNEWAARFNRTCRVGLFSLIKCLLIIITPLLKKVWILYMNSLRCSVRNICRWFA